MGRNTKKLAILAMLTGIVGVISVAGSRGSSPRPVTAPPAMTATVTHEQEEVAAQASLTQIEPPVASRVSVTFNDDTTSAYALLKGTPPNQKPFHRPDIDVWYGQYSEDYRALPASPFEKEPSRLNVKISFAF